MSSPAPERRLAELRRCESAGGRQELGAFSIEGTRLVERALRAGAPLRAVVVSRTYGARAGSREQALLTELEERASLELHSLAPEEIAELVGGRTFGDLLALVDLPAEPRLHQVLAANSDAARDSDQEFHPGLLCVVDGADPGNVGALVRTALASGARAFVAVGSTDPFHPKAVRTSMGSLFRLPILRRPDFEAWLAELAEAGVTRFAAVATGGEPLRGVALDSAPRALFVGSEAFGLPSDACERLDAGVTIPMRAGVDSLSINAAAAVCLYELLARGR